MQASTQAGSTQGTSQKCNPRTQPRRLTALQKVPRLRPLEVRISSQPLLTGHHEAGLVEQCCTCYAICRYGMRCADLGSSHRLRVAITGFPASTERWRTPNLSLICNSRLLQLNVVMKVGKTSLILISGILCCAKWINVVLQDSPTMNGHDESATSSSTDYSPSKPLSTPKGLPSLNGKHQDSTGKAKAGAGIDPQPIQPRCIL